MARFVTSNKHKKEIDSLLALRKRNDETLRQYADHYWEFFNEIERCYGVISTRGFKLGLTSQDEQIYDDLARHKPNSMKDLMTHIEGWCQLIKSKAERGIGKPMSAKTALASAAAPAPTPVSTRKKQVNNIKLSQRKGPKPSDFNAEKIVFTSPIYQIIDQVTLTTACKPFKAYLEQLVAEGHLNNFIDHEKTKARAERAENHTEEEVQTIHVIHGPLNSEAARIIRAKLNDATSSKHVILLGPESKRPRTDNGSKWTITFTEKDLDRVQLLHNDALVVTLRIRTYNVRRVLVDQGSSAEVMYYSLFKDLKLSDTDLRLLRSFPHWVQRNPGMAPRHDHSPRSCRFSGP
ncbi:uncharacterized protein LOC131302982 [Rhododendron vialii]|uniref:uncharacterized protein LOC131302982 n=1 Tax=Rhododendron vialii TaxID=182163 RepID=UPI00265EAD23|nr:uncharacterized protein LOC131302982 [Rhododendron vialii]